MVRKRTLSTIRYLLEDIIALAEAIQAEPSNEWNDLRSQNIQTFAMAIIRSLYGDDVPEDKAED